MRVITIDCHEVNSEVQFWNAYLSASRPADAGQFGRNLDAFWDALHGGPGWPGACTLRFENTAAVEPLRDGAFLESLRRIAAQSEQVRIELL
jgi:ribonuclease inhibitor